MGGGGCGHPACAGGVLIIYEEAVCDVRDDRKEAAGRLKAQALEYINDGVMIVDRTGHIMYADPSMRRIMSYEGSEVPDAGEVAERIQFAGGLHFDDILERVAEGGSWKGEASALSPDGHAVVMEVVARRLQDGQGRGMGAVIVARDVTKERMLEKQVIQSQQMELVENLSIGIAHEFKNLLTVILAYAAIVEERTVGMPVRDEVRGIIETVERANELTKRLLSLTRRNAPSREPVDVRRLLSDVVGVLQKTLPRNIRLYAPEGVELPFIAADSAILYRALLNLCLNARDAMPEGGTITIEADVVDLRSEDLASHEGRKPGRYVALSVTDTGVGMSEDVRRRIFEPFFTTKKNGTGLGLSVVQHTIHAMGGWVTVYSEEGVGTCFRLYIPVAGGESSADSTTADGEISSHGETILVVDDDTLALSVACRCLERLGYRVIEAAGGEEALNAYRVRHDEIDLVVLDIVMPFMNGEEVYREMVKIDPEVRCLAVSGFAPRTAQELFRQPGVSFLSKPYTCGALGRAVRACLVA